MPIALDSNSVKAERLDASCPRVYEEPSEKFKNSALSRTWTGVSHFVSSVLDWSQSSAGLAKDSRENMGSVYRTVKTRRRYNPVYAPDRPGSPLSTAQLYANQLSRNAMQSSLLPISPEIKLKKEEEDIVLQPVLLVQPNGTDESAGSYSINEELSHNISYHTPSPTIFTSKGDYQPTTNDNESLLSPQILQDIEGAQHQVLHLQHSHRHLSTSHAKLIEHVEVLENRHSQLSHTIPCLRDQLTIIHTRLSQQDAVWNEQANALHAATPEIEDQDYKMSLQRQEISQLTFMIQQLDVRTLHGKIQSQQILNRDLSSKIKAMEDCIDTHNRELKVQTAYVEQYQGKYDTLRKEIRAQDSKYVDIQSRIAVQESIVPTAHSLATVSSPSLPFEEHPWPINDAIQVYMMDTDVEMNDSTQPATAARPLAGANPSPAGEHNGHGPSPSSSSQHLDRQDLMSISSLRGAHDQRYYQWSIIHSLPNNFASSMGSASSSMNIPPTTTRHPQQTVNNSGAPQGATQATPNNGQAPANDNIPPNNDQQARAEPNRDNAQQTAAQTQPNTAEQAAPDAENNIADHPRLQRAADLLANLFHRAAAPVQPTTTAPNNPLYNDQQRKIMQRICRDVVRARLDIVADDDVILHIAAADADVQAFMEGNHGGPSLQDLHLHMAGMKSLWDRAAVNLLIGEMEPRILQACNLEALHRTYIEKIVWKRYGRLYRCWKSYQPQMKANGEMETAQESEARFLAAHAERLKITRHTSRRQRKLEIRRKNLEKLLWKVNATRDTDRVHVDSLNFLKKLVNSLGVDGMSDEETDEENPLYHNIVEVPWRRNLDHELSIIDQMKPENPGLFDARGAKPTTRVKRAGRFDTRKPACRLPANVYEPTWFNGMTDEYKSLYLKPKNPLQWRLVGVRG